MSGPGFHLHPNLNPLIATAKSNFAFIRKSLGKFHGKLLFRLNFGNLHETKINIFALEGGVKNIISGKTCVFVGLGCY